MKVTWKRLFWKDDDGTILVEALIVIPVVTIFAAGILEFGNVFWQRHLLEVGVRDAARYWSRCNPSFSSCSLATARNIALYGNPMGTGNLRVPNWRPEDANAISILPLVPVANPSRIHTVVVKGTMPYAPSPVFGFLEIDSIAISYSHEERYYGW